MTVSDFIEIVEFGVKSANLCSEWEHGNRSQLSAVKVSYLSGKINIMKQELKSLALSNDSLLDQSAAIDLINLLESIKVRVQAIATQYL